MKTVGLRELKNRLSEYVRDVRAGERVLVTDRGEVVAEIGPPGRPATRSDVPDALDDLARRGLAVVGRPNDSRAYSAYRPLLKPGRAAALLASERGAR